MGKPDLHDLAARAEALRGALDDLNLVIDEALSAALGVWDDEKDEAVEGTGSGDDADYFDRARQAVNSARGDMTSVQELMATLQGFREFEAQSVDG